ncbi:sulfoxide reductase heme-binding subunit YedZ [Methyloparacoccus murrellii]
MGADPAGLAAGRPLRAELTRAEAAKLRLQRAAFVAASLPALWLLARFALDALGVDPVATLTRSTGIWTLNCLMLCLAATPARRHLGWLWPLQIRRLLGLFAFFYGSLHVLVYLAFDHSFALAEIVLDVLRRPYLTAGLLAYAILAALAATSTRTMIRRLGKHWKPLHRLIYLAGIAATLHFLWLVKRDITEPGLYILVLCGLFILRLSRRRRHGSQSPSSFP